ncbi:Response regulator [Azospirillaceae bacterium]
MINYVDFSVLVIEDQPFVRKTVVQIIKKIGFEKVNEADNGLSGMDVCQQINPDIVICDIDMKPVNGLEFLITLRADKTIRNPRTPVVFLTNYSDSEMVRKAMSLGVNAFVVKPPSIAVLRERVDRLLGPAPTGL